MTAVERLIILPAELQSPLTTEAPPLVQVETVGLSPEIPSPQKLLINPDTTALEITQIQEKLSALTGQPPEELVNTGSLHIEDKPSLWEIFKEELKQSFSFWSVASITESKVKQHFTQMGLKVSATHCSLLIFKELLPLYLSGAFQFNQNADSISNQVRDRVITQLNPSAKPIKTIGEKCKRTGFFAKLLQEIVPPELLTAPQTQRTASLI